MERGDPIGFGVDLDDSRLPQHHHHSFDDVASFPVRLTDERLDNSTQVDILDSLLELANADTFARHEKPDAIDDSG
jgi:hypothetical protein